MPKQAAQCPNDPDPGYWRSHETYTLYYREKNANGGRSMRPAPGATWCSKCTLPFGAPLAAAVGAPSEIDPGQDIIDAQKSIIDQLKAKIANLEEMVHQPSITDFGAPTLSLEDLKSMTVVEIRPMAIKAGIHIRPKGGWMSKAAMIAGLIA